MRSIGFVRRGLYYGLRGKYRLGNSCELPRKNREDPFVNAALDENVVYNDFMFFLPDSVDASDSLLQNHRVPVQVIVDHVGTKLHVEAFRAHRSKQQDARLIPPKIIHAPWPFSE